MHRGPLRHWRRHLVQLRRHRRRVWHQLRGICRREAIQGRGRYHRHLRSRTHACTGCRRVKLEYWRIRTRAHLLLPELPVHRLGGPPGNAHLCSNLLPHFVFETSAKVSIVLEYKRRNASHARAADGAGVHLKPKTWDQTKERMIKMKQSRHLEWSSGTYRA